MIGMLNIHIHSSRYYNFWDLYNILIWSSVNCLLTRREDVKGMSQCMVFHQEVMHSVLLLVNSRYWDLESVISFLQVIEFAVPFVCELHQLQPSPLSILDSNQPASVITNKTEFLYEKEEQTGYNQTSVQVPVADDLQTNTQLVEPQVKEPYYSSTSEHPGIFKQFDTVGDISDHYFVHGTGKVSTLPQVKGIEDGTTIMEHP